MPVEAPSATNVQMEEHEAELVEEDLVADECLDLSKKKSQS